jgi:hypothetical protein
VRHAPVLGFSTGLEIPSLDVLPGDREGALDEAMVMVVIAESSTSAASGGPWATTPAFTSRCQADGLLNQRGQWVVLGVVVADRSEDRSHGGCAACSLFEFRIERPSLRSVLCRMWQWAFVLEHLAKITAINPAAAGCTFDEILCLALGLMATRRPKIVPRGISDIRRRLLWEGRSLDTKATRFE